MALVKSFTISGDNPGSQLCNWESMEPEFSKMISLISSCIMRPNNSSVTISPPFPASIPRRGGAEQGGESMTVSTYYDGKLIGAPMTDLSGEALLRFIEMQMVLKREVRIAPEQAE